MQMENNLQYDIFGSQMLHLSTPPRNTQLDLEDEPQEYSEQYQNKENYDPMGHKFSNINTPFKDRLALANSGSTHYTNRTPLQDITLVQKSIKKSTNHKKTPRITDIEVRHFKFLR